MIQRDEQRVIEALRAYTGGLTVTDQDITLAHDRLRDGLEPRPPRRGRVLLAAAAAAVLLVVGFFAFQAIDSDKDSAPPVDTPASPADSLRAALQEGAYNLSPNYSAGAQITAKDLAGLWMLREPYSASMFVDADGDWRIGSPKDPVWFGSSTLTGDTWRQRHDDSTGCAQGNGVPHFAHSWRAALAQDGSLRLQLTKGENVCTPAEDREVWDRVDAGSPVGDYLLAVTEDADWRAAPSNPWFGLYVAPATGHVLEVGENGTYRYYDTLDGASLVAADRGELDTTGGKATGTCTGGSFSGGTEVAQVPGVKGYVSAYDAVRITNATGSCASGIAEQGVWVNIAR